MNLTLGLHIFVFFWSWAAVISSPVKLRGEPFTIEEAVLGSFGLKSFSGKWISDFELEYQDKKSKDVKVLDVVNNKTKIVLYGAVLNKYNTSKYKFSPNRDYVLITYNESSVFRHTKTAKGVVYSIKDNVYYDVAHKETLQQIEWGPKDNTLLYVKDNNIYLKVSFHDSPDSIKITDTGIPRVVYNGISDWVYEEEILSSSKAFWFSPNGDQLVYLTLNDTGVKKSTFVEYGEPGSLKNQYSEQVNIFYPKTGSTIPDFKLWYVALTEPYKSKLIRESEQGEEIFYGINWPENDKLYYLLTNRVQNESRTYKCDLTIQNCQIVFQHINNAGWANTRLPIVGKSGNKILRIEGQPVGKSGKFDHLVLYNQNGSSTALTLGYFEVIDVLQWDEKNSKIYYLTSEEHDSTATQVFVVSESNPREPECLSCGIRSPEGRLCKDAQAFFSKMSSYVVINCNGPDPRVVYLFKNTLPLGNPIQILEDNADLRLKLKRKTLPIVVNLAVDIPGPFKADVRLFVPPNIDEFGTTKYPLLVSVYGGPASKAINNAFKFDWGFYMSTNLSVIYGFIDGRNTLRKGQNMLFAGYRALGTYEMQDQITVVRYLQSKFPFIDASKTAIWGWSYGGYSTTKILEMDVDNTFKCGIAVAPVTDWLYYDTAYTERYMGLPQENKKGYQASSTLNNVTNLRNKQYFIIHGNADDNVHYQNAMMLIKVLEKKNIPFDLMSYPDENHSLGNVRQHLYYTMDKFWKKCFRI